MTNVGLSPSVGESSTSSLNPSRAPPRAPRRQRAPLQMRSAVRAPPPRAPAGYRPSVPGPPASRLLRRGASRVAPEADGHELTQGRWSFAVLLGGYAIGLVNVWRFPYVCSAYGGAGFLLPYTVALFFIAAPLLLFEVTVGQWHQDQVGLAEAVFEKLAPRFVSLAEVQWILVFCVSLYTPVVMGYATVYMTASGYPPYGGLPPWRRGASANGSPMTPLTYWQEQVLNQVDSLSSPGWWMPAWKPLLGHSYVWAYTVMVLLQGIEGMLKAARLSILVSCTLIIVLAIICSTLDHAGAGVRYFMQPDFSELYQSSANLGLSVSQALLTLSPAMGPGIAFGSCNPQYHPMVKDVILVTVCSFLFSLASGIIMFAIIGFVAEGDRRTMQKLSERGMGMVFVTITDGVEEFPASRFLAFLFFFMLMMLGFDSLAPWVEMVLFPFLEFGARRGRSRKFVVKVGCLCMWLLGLPFTCRGGIHLMEIVDHYVPTYLLLFCAFMEYVMLMRYGIKRVLRHIGILDGTKLPDFFAAQSWFALAVLFCTGVATTYWDITSWRCVRSDFDGTCHGYYTFGGFSLAWNIILGWLPVVAALSYCIVRLILWKPEHMRYREQVELAT